MIELKDIKKYFGSFCALDNVSLTAQKGEIVGLLGQNGAGKTTLMRILTTFLHTTSGEVTVAGFDARRQPLKIQEVIGYLPENPPLYPNLSVLDYLKFAARLKGVPGREQATRIDRVLNECMLTDVSRQMIMTLSKGYKQRVGLAQAIIHDPQVLVLDEPTTGLDPVQNAQIRTLIKSLEAKRTVIISTHILSEIEQMAKRVVVIKRGRIIKDDALGNMLSTKGVHRKVCLRYRGDKDRTYQLINDIGGPQLISHETQGDIHRLILSYSQYHGDVNALAEKILHLEGHIIELYEMHPTLEDVFFELVQKKEEA